MIPDLEPSQLKATAQYLLVYASMTNVAGRADLTRRLVRRAEELLRHAAPARDPRSA